MPRKPKVSEPEPFTSPHPDKHEALLTYMAENHPPDPEAAPVHDDATDHDPTSVDTTIHPEHEGVTVTVDDWSQAPDQQ